MQELKKIVKNARKKIMNMKYHSKSSHIGSAFSVLDILVYSYFKGLNITEENLNNVFRIKTKVYYNEISKFLDFCII